MEWVETTGRSVQDAKDKALDELGVDEADAEFEVVAEAQTGLFGRLRSEARVRARVRPTAPRAKEERRNRDRKRRANEGTAAATTTTSADGGVAGGNAAGTNGGRGRGSARGAAASPAAPGSPGPSDIGPGAGTDQASGAGAPAPGVAPADTAPLEDASEALDIDADAVSGGDDDRPAPRKRNRNRNRSRASVGSTGADTGPDSDDDDLSAKGPEVEVDMDRQGEVAADFLTQLTAEFGLEAQLSLARPDDDTVEIQLTGPNLGILIGPKGATLVAVQNLTRTVVFNETGGSNGHIYVDVGGYRQKRTEALTRFATQVAEQVKANGNRTALEPMSAVDRKVVHDTISAIEGVNTISEGEEPRRRVVVLPG